MASRPINPLSPPASDLVNSGGPGGVIPFPPMGAATSQSATPQLPALTNSVAEGEAPDEEKEFDKLMKKLRPGSELHRSVIARLNNMLKFSSNKMSGNYARFRNMELKVQAYLHSQDYEELVTTINDSKGASIPQPIQIVVPYAYATLHAAATYMGTVLLGRKPMFPIMGVRGTTAEQARFMENCIQSNLDASMGLEIGWQHIWDTLLYGFGTIKCGWQEKRGKTMRWQNGQRLFTDELKFAGNSLGNIDPYNARPDPRVPLHQCHKRGDFFFDINTVSSTILTDRGRLKDDGSRELYWVRETLQSVKSRGRRLGDESARAPRGLGGRAEIAPADVTGFVELVEGTVRLSPKDWGIGDEQQSELWHFIWVEGVQILSARPLGAMHEEHPYLSGEPTSLGYDFLSMSQGEMISVFQDMLSWLVSSRMENVRASIANSYVVDPARIEMNDMRASAIGRIIRLKQAAMGLPVDQAIMQLQVNDVTGGHFNDIQTIRLLADAATGVNDNLRGIQSAGGRRSATEARMSMQAGASRLSQLAMRLSGQSFQGLSGQMISNIQQWMPEEFWIETTGDEGAQSIKATPEMLVGNFNFKVSDGTLPLDRGALLEQWKEILFGIAQDPELRQEWNLNEIFRYIAHMGGANNIDSFRRQPQKQIAGPGEDPSAGGTPTGDPGTAPPPPAALAFAQQQA
jgi:hypothetical protein